MGTGDAAGGRVQSHISHLVWREPNGPGTRISRQGRAEASKHVSARSTMHDRDILGRADRHEGGAPGRLARLRPAARAAPWDGLAVPDVGMAV